METVSLFVRRPFYYYLIQLQIVDRSGAVNLTPVIMPNSHGKKWLFLQPGFALDASDVLKGQKSEGGKYTYPSNGKTTTIPVSGIMFINITATSCKPFGSSHLPLPDGVVLKPHHYFGFRPERTNLYSMFDRRNWAAHLGMGDEPAGWAIAGEPLTSNIYPACP